MSHPQPPFRDVTVGDLLTCLAQALPDREALVYGDGPRFTFAALEQEARTIARGLMALGVGRGERVVLWATNVPEWVVLQFAVAKAGAILVTANTSLRARDVDYLLRQSEAATLITIRGFRDVDYVDELAAIGATARREIPGLERLIFLPAARGRAPASARRRRRVHAVRRAPRGGRPRVRRGARRAQRRDRPGRRDQHAVHVGHHRVSQGRDALQPQHRQQRRGAGAHARLHAGRSAVPVRAAVSLLRLRHRRARRVHAAARACVRWWRSTRSGCSRPSTASAARRSTACRRCSSRSWSARTSRATT